LVIINISNQIKNKLFLKKKKIIHLNFSVQEVPCEELEGDHPVVRQVEEVHRVNYLLRRDNQVDDLKQFFSRTITSKVSRIVQRIPQNSPLSKNRKLSRGKLSKNTKFK
jgi:hypothetical protein